MRWRAASAALLCAGLITSGALAQPKSTLDAIGCGYGLKKKGCDTEYKNAVSAIRLDETTLRVSANGNSATMADAVIRFVMRKAAEETIAAGYDVFTVIERIDTTKSYTAVSGGGSGVGDHVFPVQSSLVVKPGETLIVHMSKGAKVEGAQSYDAKEVLKFMMQG